jgi:hypothetical protein
VLRPYEERPESGVRLKSGGKPPRSKKLEVVNVDYKIRPAINEDDIATNQDMRTVGRRRRKAALQIFRARIHFLLQAWRKSAAHH